MERPSISFFAMNFILLFVIVSFVLIVFELHRFAFVFGLMLLLIFISLFAFGMFVIYHNKRWGWTIAAASLVLLLVNLFFIYLLTGIFETAHLTLLFFSIIGLGIALLNLREKSVEASEVEEHGKAKNYYPYIDKMEPIGEEPSIEKTFTPGKFIASKKANKFHAAKCDWAKKISKENQLWFNSREEAESQGFEADKCVT